jgi:hypothetical protein
MATYYDVVPNQRIVSSETVETARKKLIISMSTTTLEPQGASTKVTVTEHLLAVGCEGMGVESQSCHWAFTSWLRTTPPY